MKKGCDREIKHVPVLVSCADTSKEKEGKNQSSTTHRQEAISGSRFDFFCRFSPFAPTTVCLSLFRPSFLRHRRGRGKREEEAGKAAAAAPSQDSSSSFSSPPFPLVSSSLPFPSFPFSFPLLLPWKEGGGGGGEEQEREGVCQSRDRASDQWPGPGGIKNPSFCFCAGGGKRRKRRGRRRERGREGGAVGGGKKEEEEGAEAKHSLAHSTLCSPWLFSCPYACVCAEWDFFIRGWGDRGLLTP